MEKSIIFIFLLLSTLISYSQSLFRFAENESTFGDLSAAIVIDPNASIKESGLNIGVELEAQIKPIYIRTSITNFSALKDGYTDFTLSLGLNFSLDDKNVYRYYSGIRYGLIKRLEIFPTAGIECGFNYQPFISNVYYGMRCTYDYRSDAELYRQSGYVLIGVKF